VYLEIEDAKLGNLDSSSVKTGQEWGLITALGPDVKDKTLKVGMKVMCKGWGMDSILYDGETYLFTTESRKALKGEILK